MFDFIKRLFTKKPARQFSAEEYERHAEAKTAAMETILGPMHDMVGHAVIPFQVGGAVDMYYFPNCMPGTAFATMELIDPDGKGPRPNRLGTYELVAFTRHAIPADGSGGRDKGPFGQIEQRIWAIFTTVGHYGRQAVLNPGETCEVPAGEGQQELCLLFDTYAKDGGEFEIDGQKHSLLLCIEVFREEMEYAMENGSKALIEKLKAAACYPYSDLDRDPVV